MIRQRPGAAAAIAVLLFAFTLALYTRTMAPGTLMDLGDPGDLQAAAAALGVPHPTGYPLFVLIGWAWVHIVPLGTMAYRLTLLSAVFGSLAVVLTFLLAMRVTGRALPSLAGALLFGLGYTFWAQTSISEVYTLNAVFVAGRVPAPAPVAGEGRGGSETRPYPLATTGAPQPADPLSREERGEAHRALISPPPRGEGATPPPDSPPPRGEGAPSPDSPLPAGEGPGVR